MNIQTILTIVPVVLVVIALALIILMTVLRLRSRRLKKIFGPEYDYTLERLSDRRSAEADLQEREKRVVKLDIRPLNETERVRYQTDWTDTQASFVDDPSGAVERASRLITEVMIARGFPVADFEQRCSDLSVIYPNYVAGYREANTISTRNQGESTSTEDLRRAMINYHSLFVELLKPVRENEKEMEIDHGRQLVSH